MIFKAKVQSAFSRLVSLVGFFSFKSFKNNVGRPAFSESQIVCFNCGLPKSESEFRTGYQVCKACVGRR